MTMPEMVFECDASEADALKKALEYDPYLDKSLDEEGLKRLSQDKSANVIFARQAYDLRDAGAFGIKNGRYYLYIKASEEFLKGAEQRLRAEFKTVKRAGEADSAKVIHTIKDEEERANAGIGSIFGG